MKKIIRMALIAGLFACPIASSAAEFGVVDASQIFNKYSETQRTKKQLEGEKAKLQTDLEAKKGEVKKLDDEYMKIAKKLQALRDAKKEKEARALEPQLRSLRQQLSAKTGSLQKFFEESQKHLYDLEQKKMGNLSKALDEKVDQAIEKVSKKYKLKAVFEKRFFYYGEKNTVKDITAEVLSALNKK